MHRKDPMVQVTSTFIFILISEIVAKCIIYERLYNCNVYPLAVYYPCTETNPLLDQWNTLAVNTLRMPTPTLIFKSCYSVSSLSVCLVLNRVPQGFYVQSSVLPIY